MYSKRRFPIRYSEFMKGAYSKVYGRYYRTMGPEPEEKEDGTHTNVNETIDATVFERWRAAKDYRPPNGRLGGPAEGRPG